MAPARWFSSQTQMMCWIAPDGEPCELGRTVGRTLVVAVGLVTEGSSILEAKIASPTTAATAANAITDHGRPRPANLSVSRKLFN